MGLKQGKMPLHLGDRQELNCATEESVQVNTRAPREPVVHLPELRHPFLPQTALHLDQKMIIHFYIQILFWGQKLTNTSTTASWLLKCNSHRAI